MIFIKSLSQISKTKKGGIMGFRTNKLMTLKVDSDDVQVSEHLNDARRLFFTITKQALKDIKMSLNKGQETRESREAYEWFWSKDFKYWCELAETSESNYRFKNLKRTITEKKKTAKYNNIEEQTQLTTLVALGG